MVWNRIRDAISGPPTLDGPSILPPYFPVEPAGCERHAQKLFECLATKATEKARDMEKAGYAKSYYPDVEAERVKKMMSDEKSDVTKLRGGDEVAVVASLSSAAPAPVVSTTDSTNDSHSSSSSLESVLPTPEDNPLDECRQLIAYYQRCCDRELKKKKNWILTEPYRVQEEYRYDNNKKK